MLELWLRLRLLLDDEVEWEGAGREPFGLRRAMFDVAVVADILRGLLGKKDGRREGQEACIPIF